eukprot:CAMPEP_0197884244 /NCGR_PEP_ID=MMETSP1439-20131203/10773_1 /TAXON_ID=66791 /ORGANISM="Gonyaulax spinifera, Strain CCMP409" /LENGTH=70 /DNA_ID=CAMNT_0043503973 /DNA_START=92 /DNA_END=304 /DNA_ORIENTATION=-
MEMSSGPTPVAKQGPELPPAPAKLACVRCAPLQPSPVSGKLYKCQECSQSFETEHALKLHVKYIHQSKED